MRLFGLLELEIWAEHWTVSGLQERFRLLCCCYNLDLKTALLNLGLLMKVVGLCLTFPSIKRRPKSEVYNSRYDQITEQCSSLDCTNVSFLSLAISLSFQFQYFNSSINYFIYVIGLHLRLHWTFKFRTCSFWIVQPWLHWTFV